jgi:tRNA pseudouridine(55) synthase
MIEVYKKRYDTCLQMLDQLRIDQPHLHDEILSYAGVLDPMAEGIVPVLVGKEENQNRVSFTQAKKRYQFEVLVGVSTDTYDLLGLVERSSASGDAAEIITHFLSHERKFDQIVSQFSNKKYKGKPLWEWGRAGIIVPEEERPFTHVEILELESLGSRQVSKVELSSEIEEMSKKISNSFRIDAVRKNWEQFLNQAEDSFLLLGFDIYVSKGFYIRKLVEDISRKTGIAMTVYTLKRTEIVYG